MGTREVSLYSHGHKSNSGAQFFGFWGLDFLALHCLPKKAKGYGG